MSMSNQEIIKQTIRNEKIRCAKDPVYFLKKYSYIQSVTKGKTKFELFPFQEEVLKDFHSKTNNIVLKSRQMGISTLTAGYILWSMIFRPNTKALVIATKQSTAQNLIGIVKYMYKFLPSWMADDAENNNQLSLKLTNGSWIKASSAAADAGRSESLNFLVFDEAAFIPNIETIWASAQQTIATGGKAIIISTPNGQGNWYHRQWIAAELGMDDDFSFNPIKLEWQLHPERDEEWLQRQKKIINDPRTVSQEILCDFVSSGHNVIESSIIEKIKETTLQEPLQRIGIDNCTWIWKHPVAGKDYLITADVSRGDGSDYSSCHILDLETMEQVGEYKGLMDTNEYGRWLTILGEMYNKALIVLENNGVGWATVQSIIDRGYSNLYWSYKSIDFVDVDVLMMKNYDTEDRTKMIPGVTTNSRNRPLMIEKLQQYFREESLVIHSRRMISELETFIWNNNKAQAQSGFNDDLIMSLAIGCWVRDTALRLRKESMDSYKNNLKYYGKAVYTNNNHQEDAYSMKLPNGQSMNLRELLNR